jgi:oxygen-independent coproporphyrinogen-3 oxidase
MPELGLYVHFPFCPHKCGYCDFNSYTLDLPQRLPGLLAALHQEIEARAGEGQGFTVTSVFFGGGTPTLYSGEELVGVLDHLRQRYPFASGEVEVTVEANPGTVDLDQLRVLRRGGVNRVSFGAQSFVEEELRFLERVHGPQEVAESVRSARAAGFGRVNLDLMFGLPGQTWQRLAYSLQEALRLEPDHISLYALELEPNTRFGRLYRQGSLELPQEDEVVEMGDRAAELLAAHGYRRYEVSNFAKPGQECRHNLHTWRRGAYLGFGPGAHSFRSERRFWNVRSPAAYQRRLSAGELPVEDGEDVSDRRLGEWIYLRLRLTEGVRFDEFAAEFGEDARRRFAAELGGLEELGLIAVDKVGFRATDRGRWLLNRVVAAFLPS